MNRARVHLQQVGREIDGAQLVRHRSVAFTPLGVARVLGSTSHHKTTY
jgi:hypothetical protein